MKQLDRKLVKEMARITRKYAKTGDTDLLAHKHETALQLALGSGICWDAFYSFFEALCGVYPIKSCTDEEIEAVLQMLGIEVIDKGVTE